MMTEELLQSALNELGHAVELLKASGHPGAEEAAERHRVLMASTWRARAEVAQAQITALETAGAIRAGAGLALAFGAGLSLSSPLPS